MELTEIHEVTIKRKSIFEIELGNIILGIYKKESKWIKKSQIN